MVDSGALRAGGAGGAGAGGAHGSEREQRVGADSEHGCSSGQRGVSALRERARSSSTPTSTPTSTALTQVAMSSSTLLSSVRSTLP